MLNATDLPDDIEALKAMLLARDAANMNCIQIAMQHVHDVPAAMRNSMYGMVAS